MKTAELKQAVEQIELDDIGRQRMIRELRMGRRGKRRYRRMTKAAAVAAVCILAVGAVGIPVRAFVNSLVKERMEAIPEEKIKETVEQIDRQEVGADSFTRDYTESEKARYRELFQAYENGTFPAGELQQVDSEAEAEGKEFCYLTTISRFYLPADRELTDEELLELIDFNEKRNYALKKRYEEEFAEEEAQEKKQIEENIEGGGITEQEAIDIAGGYLQRLFDVDGNGMELAHYYSQAGEIYDMAVYGVNWSIRSQAYYYFFIDAADGKLVSILCSDGLRDNPEYQAGKPSQQEAVRTAAAIREKAADFLKNEMGIDEAYTKAESCYYTYTGEGIEEVSDTVSIHFIKEDGSIHELTFDWEGNFRGYSHPTVEDYAKHVELFEQRKGEELTERSGKEVTVRAVLCASGTR